MSCEYCLTLDGKHHPKCPNYIPPKAVHYCSYCNEGIFDEEEYIENYCGECMHYDCIPGTRQLLNWLGCDIKKECSDD